MLIGGDQYYKFVYDNSVFENAHLIPSDLGILLAGNTVANGKAKSDNASVMCHINCNNDSLDNELQNLWKTDVIGISDIGYDNDLALKNFEKNLNYGNGKYTVRLPWKDNYRSLPDNFELAEKRLKSLVKKLSNNSLLEMYDEIIKSQVDNDFIEIVNDDTVVSPEAVINYLPHHCVHKDSSSTPIRIVYDCSAKLHSSSPSLNDCLVSGPSLLQDLGQLILRFRQHDYACISDISKAYLRIGLHLIDRDATRFLWYDNVKDFKNCKLVVYRFKVVLFGSTASQFLMCAVINHHLNKFGNKISEALRNGIYADNIQFTCFDENDLEEFYVNSKEMHSANFTLHQWATNSHSFMDIIKCNGDIASNFSAPSILGLVWETSSDSLCFHDNLSYDFDSLTKRKILHLSAKIFDPLGWLLPVTIRTRMFLQDLWRLGIDWDEEMDP